jgi:hypothetical protein
VSGLLLGIVTFFHDVSQIHFAGAVRPPQNVDKEYSKLAARSKEAILNYPLIVTLFPDVIEQIKSEMNGESPKHCLPFPPEYFAMLSKLWNIYGISLLFRIERVCGKDSTDGTCAAGGLRI